MLRAPRRPARRAARYTAAALAAALLACGAAGPAHAHVAFGASTLSELVADADVVARARIVDAGDVLVLDTPPLRRPVCRAELVEVLKGDVAPGPVRFAQHGHGVAEFENGEEVILFLHRLERSRELADLALTGALRWVSLQEHDAKYATSGPARDALVAAARDYLMLGAIGEPAARLAALSRVTLRLLGSGEPRLAASALSDLVRLANVPLVGAKDLPTLEPLLEDPSVALAVRVGLLAELERRGLIDGAPHWAALLRTAPAADLPAVVSAAGAHPSAAVTAELVRILEAPDAVAAAEAAVALGSAGHAAAAAPLARALAAPDARLRLAAVRGLRALGTKEARATLERAAASHPDTATRRSARAAAALLTPGAAATRGAAEPATPSSVTR